MAALISHDEEFHVTYDYLLEKSKEQVGPLWPKDIIELNERTKRRRRDHKETKVVPNWRWDISELVKHCDEMSYGQKV